jgi:formylglycine-generating enzyme required for sulfatase activity
MKNLKTLMVTLASVGALGMGLTASQSAVAKEGGIGNGGGTWVCQNNDSLGTIRWAKLVDLYEGRTEFSRSIPEVKNLDSDQIVDQIMVRRLFPISEDLYKSINDELETVKSNLVMVNADLQIVDDALYRIRPMKTECLGGTISYVQLANYTDYGKILIQENLFQDPHLSETDKAALMIHEAVYAFLRDRYSDKTSVRARKLVGLLFSTINQESLKKEIEKLLGGGLDAVAMDFVRVRAGSFMMGSSDNESGRYDDEKLHLVQLTNDYEIQTTDVTQKQYYDVMGVNPSNFKNMENCPKTFMAVSGTTLCPNNPVESVSYNDVQNFLLRLNANRKDGHFYRLPTEAEWEFAARAGTSTAYSFGNDASQLPLYAWYSGNSGNQTHEVAQLRPNALGLYDMHGNVWQWVQDWYGDYSNAGQMNPMGSSSGSYRVIRGGSWNNVAQFTRSASRNYYAPSIRFYDLGFRLVRTSP